CAYASPPKIIVARWHARFVADLQQRVDAENLRGNAPTEMHFTPAWLLVCAPAPQYRPGRKGKNLQIRPDRPVLDVLAVQPNHLFEVHHGAPTANLPQACDPRLRPQTSEVPILVGVQVGLEERPGANQRHVAHEDVPQLG